MQLLLKDVEYCYNPEEPKPFLAVSGLNFSINKGEFIAMIGHSGSGKSTLAMLLSGLYLPTAGQVLFNGKAALKNSVFPGAGMVFQYPEHQLFGETVFEEVSFGPRNFGIPETQLESIVRDALVTVGLDPDSFIERSPFTLSGGEKRRVVIACILATKAEFLLFDEPSAGLDEKGRQWMINLAKNEHSKGKTIIWVSHNMEEVAELAQRVLVLDKGKLVLDGTPKEVFRQEDMLQSMSLAVPQPAVLLRRLKSKGLPLAADGITEDEAFAEITSLKGGAEHA